MRFEHHMQKRQKNGRRVLEKKNASVNGGIVAEALLTIAPDHTVPCLMHAIMGIPAPL
jgi:hypothetical protein